MRRLLIALLLLPVSLAAQLPCANTFSIGTLTRRADSVAVLTETRCQIAIPANGWIAEYWRIPHRPNIAGQPLAPALPTDPPFVVRVDTAINFDWGLGPVDPRYPADTSGIYARWTRRLPFDGGTYHFTATVDDGVKLFLDGVSRMESWIEQSATPHSVDVTLTPGQHVVEMQWYENEGGAVAKLSWVRLPDAPVAGPHTVAAVSLVPKESPLLLVPGQTRQLYAATAFNDGGLAIGNGALQWLVDSQQIATVTTGIFAGTTQNGTLKALTPGNATMIVRDSASGKADTLRVQVVQGNLPVMGVYTNWIGFLGCPVTVGSTCTRGPYAVFADDGSVVARLMLNGTFSAP